MWSRLSRWCRTWIASSKRVLQLIPYYSANGWRHRAVMRTRRVQPRRVGVSFIAGHPGVRSRWSPPRALLCNGVAVWKGVTKHWRHAGRKQDDKIRVNYDEVCESEGISRCIILGVLDANHIIQRQFAVRQLAHQRQELDQNPVKCLTRST